MTKPPFSSEEANDDARDEAVGRLINEFFDRRESGEVFTKDEFLAEHPDYADELREHLRGLDLIKGIGSSSGDDGFQASRTQSVARDRHAAAAELENIHIPEIPGYKIQRPLGRGGMGIVYKAIQVSTGRQVALKVLLEGPFAAPQARKRFEREISLSAQLRHPNIIPIYDSGEIEGRMYYAMEYVRGLPLGEYIQRENPNLNRRLQLFLKVGAALRHAHQRGVIHRDLKPSNVLVNADGEPHLLDFGLAKQGTFSDMTTSLTAQIIGTPAYMSPEQAAGDPSGVDVRTDVYSLGVVLFELVAGEMPYETKVSIGRLLDHIAKSEPDTTHLSKANIDAELTAILLKALAKSKDERYQSVDAFVSDVSRYMADEPISVRPASGVYLLRKVLWKHRVAIAAVMIAAVMFASAGYLLHRVNTALSENKEQIARQDQRLREQEAQIEKKENEIAAWKTTLRSLNFTPTQVAAVNAFAKSIAEGVPAVDDVKGMLASAGQGGANDGSPPSAQKPPGKDLEAGYGDVVIADVSPGRLAPASQESAKLPSPIMGLLRDYMRLGKTAPKGETEKVPAASQPTSQPADSVAGVVETAEADDDAPSPTSEESPRPKAADKS